MSTLSSLAHESLIEPMEALGFVPIGYMRFSDGNRELCLKDSPEHEIEAIHLSARMAKGNLPNLPKAD